MLQHSDQIFIVLLEVHTLQIIVAEEKNSSQITLGKTYYDLFITQND